ncbi:hypothetical protein EES43_25530 [Streptomyces sp. ADI96-02]|nr:hypothetical protein EES43_25530 [Streptomyces sp. ADI96-02]
MVVTVPSAVDDLTGRSPMSYSTVDAARSPAFRDNVAPLARSETVVVVTSSAPVTASVRRPTFSASLSTEDRVDVTAGPGFPPAAAGSPVTVDFAISPASSPPWYANSSTETVRSSPVASFAAFVTVLAMALPSPVRVSSTTRRAPSTVSRVSVCTGIE